MKKRIGSYPRVRIEGGGRAVVLQDGSVLLVETVCKAGLDTAISAALTPWRHTRVVHDRGNILLDVALGVALGGDCLADVTMLRAELADHGARLDPVCLHAAPVTCCHARRSGRGCRTAGTRTSVYCPGARWRVAG